MGQSARLFLADELQAAFEQGHHCGSNDDCWPGTCPYDSPSTSGLRSAWLNGFTIGRLERVRGEGLIATRQDL